MMWRTQGAALFVGIFLTSCVRPRSETALTLPHIGPFPPIAMPALAPQDSAKAMAARVRLPVAPPCPSRHRTVEVFQGTQFRDFEPTTRGPQHSLIIYGYVRAAESRQPLSNVRVSTPDGQAATHTSSSGQYALSVKGSLPVSIVFGLVGFGTDSIGAVAGQGWLRADVALEGCIVYMP